MCVFRNMEDLITPINMSSIANLNMSCVNTPHSTTNAVFSCVSEKNCLVKSPPECSLNNGMFTAKREKNENVVEENVGVSVEVSDSVLSTDNLDTQSDKLSSDVHDSDVYTIYGRGLKYRVIEDHTNLRFNGNPFKKKMIDKSDPRSRLHFIKYVTIDGRKHKIWECGLCGKEFRHQYILLRHVPTHTDERNFPCEICGKSFRQLSTLAQHRAIHSDARPYICEVCKKTFNRVSTLISHRKTHSSDKPHKCKICGKGFHQKGNLRNHLFTHTNERPYKCDLCGKGFNQMSNLVCHKSHVHTQKQIFYCNLCNRIFPGTHSLRRHEECKHGLINKNSNLAFVQFLSDNKNKANVSDSGKKIAIIEDNPENKIKLNENFVVLNEPSISEVVIDAIKTKAMKMSKRNKQVQSPFAVLKPVNGVPVLVKIKATSDGREILVPATAQDIKSASLITPDVSNGPVKTMQVTVPIVATVTQTCNPSGELTIHVTPPSPKTCQSDNQEITFQDFLPLNVSLESQETDDEICSSVLESSDNTSVVHVEAPEENDSIVDRESDSCNSIDDSCSSVPENLTVLEVDPSMNSENMELSVEGGIKFLKYSEDGKCQLISQQDIVQSLNEVAEVISIETYNSDNQNSSSDMTMSDLVDILRSAGYWQ